MIDELNWGFLVIGYLFLAGIGAGAVLVSAAVALGAGPFRESRFAIARYGAYIAPLPVIVGTGLIVLELGQPFRVLNLFKLITLSPMSVGSWFVGLFIVVAILYALTYVPRSASFDDRLNGIRRLLGWACLPLGFGVAIYTAVLLGNMPARPFWNSPAIALLFVLSALSGGIASIVLSLAVFRRRRIGLGSESGHDDGVHVLGRTEALLLVGELVVILLFILFAYLSGSNSKEAITVILTDGALAVPFWGLVVLVGIVVPAAMESGLMARGRGPREMHKPRLLVGILAPVAVLIGGFVLRYVVVVAGQVTGPVGI